MPIGSDHENEAPANSEQAFLRQLRRTFEQMPNEIPLYLFVDRSRDDVYVDACRQIIRAFRELSTKITVKEFYLDHEMAAKWGVDSSPTLLIDPDRFHIRWIGAPMGDEGR